MDRRRVVLGLARACACTFAATGGITSAGAETKAETPRPNVFHDLVAPLAARATGIRVFKFRQPYYAGTKNRTVAALAPLPKGVMLAPEARDFIKAALADESSYLAGVLKATRFYADYGMVLEGTGTPNIILVSTTYKGAVLVLSRPIPGSDAYANLDPVFAEVEGWLKQSLR